MKLPCVAFVTTLLVCPASAADDPHVRSLDPAVALAYEAGYRESSTFRSLVAARCRTRTSSSTSSAMSLCPAASVERRAWPERSAARYVRIDLASSLTYRSRVAVFGHELQHACEIARSGAASSHAVEALFRSIGKASSVAPGGFETFEAEAAGRQVLAELAASRARARTTEQ
jgi:hypothetical protein